MRTNGEGDGRGTHTTGRAGKRAKRRTRFNHTPFLAFWDLMSALSLMFVFGPRVLAKMKDVSGYGLSNPSLLPWGDCAHRYVDEMKEKWIADGGA